MKYDLKYFIDDLLPNARIAPALAPAHRLVYVSSGTISLHGEEIPAHEGTYSREGAGISAGRDGAQVLRWDLVPSGTADAVATGDGVSSRLRMAREIWSLDIDPGSPWLLRLDRIDNPPGSIADVHTHPGPGIRALLAGSFRCKQPSEDGIASEPGDPWWETGVEAVISTPDAQRMSSFLRAMVLPVEFRGRSDTATWLRRPPSDQGGGWRLLVDEIVEL